MMYADDIVVYNSGPSIDEVIDKLTCDMALVTNWSIFNRLTINYSKSNFMIFGSRSNLRKINVPPVI